MLAVSQRVKEALAPSVSTFFPVHTNDIKSCSLQGLVMGQFSGRPLADPGQTAQVAVVNLADETTLLLRLGCETAAEVSSEGCKTSATIDRRCGITIERP